MYRFFKYCEPEVEITEEARLLTSELNARDIMMSPRGMMKAWRKFSGTDCTSCWELNDSIIEAFIKWLEQNASYTEVIM